MKDAKKLLTEFLRATERQVLDAFAKIPNSVKSKSGEWVYLPGKRDDRVLLVAHADTVRWKDKAPVDLIWIGDVVAVAQESRDNALGGDDRAGCAMMFDLWDGTHSVLITTGEERGCIGARTAVREIGEELAKHQFAVQVDRRGNRQAVFYDVATREFKDYMVSSLSRFDYEKVAWREYGGSSTDIRTICPEVGICGVNLSAGFYHEHSDSEMVVLGSWLHTRYALKKILKQERLERFVLPKARGLPALATQRATEGIGASVSAGQTEAFEIAIPETLSNRHRKKLVAKVRQAYQRGLIKRLTAWGYMEDLFAHLPRGEQFEAISKALPLGKNIPVSESQPVKLCDECNRALGYHKLSCSKRPESLRLPATDEERCSTCGAYIKYGHFKGCPSKVAKITVVQPDEKGNAIVRPVAQCGECAALVGHYASCSHAAPVLKVTKCAECNVDFELFGHLPGCSKRAPEIVKPLNAHVRGSLDIITCVHYCLICRVEDRKGTGAWKHIRASGSKCPLYIQAPCPGHSKDTNRTILVGEAEVDRLRKALS